MKIHCNHCRHETNHDLLKREVSTGADEDQDFKWRTEFDMLQCRGCEEVTLRRKFDFSEDPESSITFYPPRVARWLPAWKYSLPREMKGLMEEVYKALQADSRRLAMMGARAVIEYAMQEKVGDNGTFAENLQKMEEAGFVSRTNRKYLDVALDAGSAVIHRGHLPTDTQLETVMDIVENLLHSLFVLEKPSGDLKATIPSRPVRKKAEAVIPKST